MSSVNKPNAPPSIPTEARNSSANDANNANLSYTEYSLRCCTQEEIEGVRHHVLKFQSRNKVEPAKQFDAPVRLHRKDPRNLQFQLTRREIEERKREREEKLKRFQEKQLLRRLKREEDEANGVESMDVDDLADLADGDSDLEEVLRLAAAEANGKNGSDGNKKAHQLGKQQSKPTTDLTVVAPDGGARNQKKNPFKKKTRQVNVVAEDKRKLRYEEYYPWVMEDYDGKNTWVGSYELGSSDSYVVFVFDNEGFKMIPVEKVYKFTPRNKYATLTLEEAESRMQKNSQVPRWLMKHMADENKDNGMADPRFRKNTSRLKTVVGSNREDSRGSDNEDIDFDDEFDDDEEAPIMEDEEQNRDSERRMKREMLTANALGIERTYDEEDEEEDEEFADLFGSKKLEDKDVKKLRKTLVKSEMNDAYDTDDEENPYLSRSEDEDEELAQNEAKKEASETPSVKVEASSNGNGHSNSVRRSASPLVARQIFVTSTRQQFVTIKAPPKVLELFPKGEWNPNLPLKRKFRPELDDNGSSEETASKRIKLETPFVKQEPLDSVPLASVSAVSPGSASPAAKSRANTPPVEDDLLSEDDIKSVVSSGPIKIKDLLSRLKAKIHRHPENKNRIKLLVKKCLKQQDGFLYLKEGA